MKIHTIDSPITSIGIEILRKKLLNPNESIKEISKEFNLLASEQDSALASAQHHLGIKVRTHASPATRLPYMHVVELEPKTVTFGDISMLYLAPEPEWMEDIDFNKLPPTTDEKAINYMSNKF